MLQNLASGLLQIGHDVTIFQHGFIGNIFDVAVFLFSNLVTGPSLINIITGSEVIAIFVYKEFTRNQGIRNTPTWVFLKFWYQIWQ